MSRDARKKVIPKKRGRPATGKDPLVALRLPPELIKAIDAWAAKFGKASRSEAIRTLIETSLEK
ncbi:MAG: ribbon-helix-helix domain-containing protein [Xanthobacteraceae bacterium]|nr:ribbon-helix-helix domain-containing protein [Xanthobacteraceae bacterium]